MTVQPQRAGQDEFPPLQALVIEDDPDTTALIKATLSRAFEGSSVKTIDSLGAIPLSDLAYFDIVFCDHNLPDGSSFEAIERITLARDDLPVVVVTGGHDAEIAAEAIRRGASDYLPKSHSFLTLLPVIAAKTLEAARIRRDNNRLQAALASSLAELKRKNKELKVAAERYKSLAAVDSLTGLTNRRVLDERLVQMFAEAQRYQHALTCLMIDLDGFKGVNDTLGHRVGDQMLELAGQLVAREIRSTDVGARYGGDEFVILMPHTAPDDAARLADRLVARFEQGALAIAKRTAACSMSVGVATTLANSITQPWELLAHADFALYEAKANERFRIMLCEPGGESALPFGSEAA